MSKRGRTPRREWVPLAQGSIDDASRARLEADNGWTPGTYTVWLNDRYQVWRRDAGHGMIHLSIKRRDKKPVHDWRHLQQIKNELVGPECEGVELYPAESRLVDEANQFHLWCVADPRVRIPVGYAGRLVAEPQEARTGDGLPRQREWEAGLTTGPGALGPQGGSEVAPAGTTD